MTQKTADFGTRRHAGAASPTSSTSSVTRAAARRRPAATPAARGLDKLQVAPDALGFALDGAAQAVGAVRAGAALPAALTAVNRTIDLPAARGAIQDIAYRTMRSLGCAEAVLAALVPNPPPPHVANLLACALSLLAEAPQGAYAPFVVVDQAVSAVAARREFAFAKGLVNAVLRNFLRARETLLADVRRDPVARWNYPRWWIEAVMRAWPDAWQATLAAGNAHAPLTLRVNRRRTTVEQYLQTLQAQQIAARAIGPSAVCLAQPLPVERLPGFAQGLVSVQDAGAQCAAMLLGVGDGMRVLDACAAPGGKTGHLLELADIDLVALDSDAARAARIDQNLRRLGQRATLAVGDAGSPGAWYDGRPFDRILADVPCSASGIVRRHPDIRWLRRESDIPTLVAAQRRILGALWPLLKPHGELLYVTCSILPQEGEMQAQWFESAQQDAVRLDAPGQMLPTLAAPDTLATTDHDGFFYARFQKR